MVIVNANVNMMNSNDRFRMRVEITSLLAEINAKYTSIPVNGETGTISEPEYHVNLVVTWWRHVTW